VEATYEERLVVLQSRERELRQAIYNQVISKRIGDMSKDEAMSRQAVANMDKFEKQLDMIEQFRKEEEAEK